MTPTTEPKRVPKWSQNGTQIPPKAFPGGSGSGLENDVKIDLKNGAEREPKWSPNGSQNPSKIDSGRGPGAEVPPQGSPRGPKGPKVAKNSHKMYQKT